MRIAVCCCLVLLFPLSAYASIPVIDFASIENLLHNYSMLKQQYEAMRQQIDVVKQLKQAAIGHYGLGGLLNDEQSFTNRQWSPGRWQDALQGLAGGNPERYQQLLTLYKKDNPTISQQQFERASTAAAAQQYQHNIEVNRAATVNASYAFDTVKQHLATIHTISEQIDKTDNTKAAVDLNSRLIAELAYIHTQELKMQVMLNQQMARTSADRLDQQSDAAVFNTLKE